MNSKLLFIFSCLILFLSCDRVDEANSKPIQESDIKANVDADIVKNSNIKQASKEKKTRGGYLYSNPEAKVSEALQYVESGKSFDIIKPSINGFYYVSVNNGNDEGYMFYSALGMPK